MKATSKKKPAAKLPPVTNTTRKAKPAKAPLKLAVGAKKGKAAAKAKR